MIKKLLFLLVLLLTATTGAVAQTWDSGACKVTFSDGVLTVSGTGVMADYKDFYTDLPWYGYDIKTIVIESGVTSIGDKAFGSCGNLESVSIPASVTSIGKNAFQDCGLYAEALTVSFAEGSTPLTIGEGAFNNANLKSIDIPNRVTSIGKSAFSYCTHLESVSIPASVTSIGGEAFQNCGSEAAALTVSFAEGSTPLTISEYAFYQANLKSIDIPNRVTSIGDVVFCGCSNLESVSIPASVTSIGNSAFSGCKKMESVSIPASVTSISEYAFSYCSKLAKVYIFASSLTTYGAYAFDGNADGRKIYVLPEAVNTYKAKWQDYAADIEAMPTYAITLAEGTEDAGKWTVKAGTDGSFQSLPLEGVKAGTKVKLKYDGDRSMVKGVTAVKKAAIDPAKAYLTWDADQKKLVATEIPATYNTVANASTDVSWSAGTYVVDGQVTITGTITLSGDVNLIIKDGAKLTANKIMGDDKNLSIYGQAQKTGELVVSNSADAIRGMSTLEVHSAKVTATASTNSCGGIYSISTFNVYGGEVDAKATGYGYGISLNANGSMNIYGGEVKAEGKGNSVSYSYGIRCGNSSTATVTVYGGKLLAWNANNKAFYHINLTIDKSLGFNGEIETSSDNSTWNPTVGTPDAKYVRVGF